MQFKMFAIPVGGDPSAEDDLNRFLRAHRVVSVQKELVQVGATGTWAFCVEYLDNASSGRENASGRQRIDYKTILSPEDFALFAKLRDARKQLAAQDAVPVYTVCTNEHLAAIARLRPAALADFQQVEGFGQAKAEKYFFEERLNLAVNAPCMNSCHRGLTFLGYRIFPGHVRLARRSRDRFRKKFAKYQQYYQDGLWDESTVARHVEPMLAFARRIVHRTASVFLGSAIRIIRLHFVRVGVIPA